MFAFSTRTLYYIVLLVGIKTTWNYTTAFLEAVFYIIWVIIPITSMLYMHNKTFHKIAMQH